VLAIPAAAVLHLTGRAVDSLSKAYLLQEIK
jgi:hypothetical protein